VLDSQSDERGEATMSECRFQEKQRPSLYILIFFVWLYLFTLVPTKGELNQRVDELKAMQPCSQQVKQ
jgi:hypothetical protein